MSIKVSLRELLQAVRCDSGITLSAYALLKALVEAVEPSGPAELDDLRKQRDGWEQGCWQAEQELAEARVEMERLRRNCDYLRRQRGLAIDARVDARRELAEAKAEIKNLQRGRYWQRRCWEAEDKHDTDAELGKLVKGMGRDTRLWHNGDGWYIAQKLQGKDPPQVRWWDTLANETGSDPVSALRTIQEADDAEA